MSSSAPQDEDIIGDRVLVGLQSVRISRLSTHPIPIAVGTLVAVAGQGPKDSNGAGKSSLLAEFSLLHGDEQWRFGSGAPAAVDLLFTSEDAGGEDLWGSADHGYLIGVFALDTGTLEQLHAAALTVWIRIDRSTQRGPRLKLRWQHGLHLSTGNSEDERELAADSVWQTMPTRAGRQDVSARDLPRVLYGDHVRCVSFLSTSVRAGAAPNLLAQPLNELSERRIFEAIAALTGIDRELDIERQARRNEHDRLRESAEAEAELSVWEENADVVEAGIDARDRARECVVEATGHWRSRTARLLCDVLVCSADILVAIAEIDAAIERDSQAARVLRAQAEELADDKAFAQRQQEVVREFERADTADRDLGNQIATLVQRIEDTDLQLRQSNETARDADGRDEPAADQERAAADIRLEAAVKAVGVAEKAVSDAEEGLRDAESGNDLARQQLELLTAAGIDAICLLDAVALTDRQRPKWEPALWPYREAAVVDVRDLDRAAVLLGEVPGSILIAANIASSADRAVIPGAADARFDLGGFLSAIDARTAAHADPDRVHDEAGVVIIGGFPSPVTGRAVRIEAARERVRRESTARQQAQENRRTADQHVATAKRRQKGARAAVEADRLAGVISRLRSTLERTRIERTKLAPAFDAARTERDEVVRLSAVRKQQIQSLQHQKSMLENTNKSRQEQRDKLETEQSQLGIPELSGEWNGTPESANQYILDLPDNERSWTADDWWDLAKDLLSTAISECFPANTADNRPTEISGLLEKFNLRGPGSAKQAQTAFPQLRHALHVYLRQLEGTDRYERRQIGVQRKERNESLEAARIGHEEAIQASRAHRAALASAIKRKLADVGTQFDRLDRAHGGYGASLQFDEPPPPADPTEVWGWKVTPMWRRAEGLRHIPYNRRANTAQMDDRAIKLVCAAAAASGTGRPLVLVLDELGRNLGKQHRREAVALLGQIGKESGITVIAALQDDMESYTIDACGEYIKLRRSSDSTAYNEQPVVIGYDEHTPRVELLRAWLTGNEYGEPA